MLENVPPSDVQSELDMNFDTLMRLSETLELANVGVFNLDLETRIAQWNTVAAREMGYDAAKKAINREEFYSRVHPDDREMLASLVQKAVETRAIMETEFRVVWPSGQTHWVMTKWVAKYDPDGKPRSAGGILFNIEEKKQKEMQLQLREKGFSRLYESNIIGIAFGRVGDGVYEANDAYLDMLGWTQERLLKEGPLEWWRYTPEAYRVIDNLAVELAKKNGVSDVFEKEYVLEDGTRKHVLVGVALQGVEDKAIAFVLDISKQKNAEILLRRSHERYTSFIAQSSEGIWRFEMDRPMPVTMSTEDQVKFFFAHAYIAECNDALARMFGFNTAEAVIGKKIGDVFPAAEEYRGYIRTFIENGYVLSNVEGKGVNTFGHTVYSSNTLRGFCEDGYLKRAWGLQRDITSQKIIQAELIRARELAESANNAKTAFLANVSHEIRTPLGAILGFSEFLQDNTIHTEEEKQKFREIIRRNGFELTRLIDDILDLSKVESDHMEVVRSEFDIEELMEDVFRILRPKAEAKDIEISFRLNLKKKRVCTDRSRLRQILINLVTNAIKFTENGEAKVLARTVEKPSPGLEFFIEDSGIGISKEQAERLFKPFSQVDNSTTRRFGGTGLGLALSKKLAKAIGGDVCLWSSRLGGGSVFRLTVEDYEQATDTAAKGQEEHALRDLTGTKVLVVDDSADNRLLIEKLLKRHGLIVDSSSDGAHGVEKALSQHYDVILMDLQMPVMDGYTATKILRESGYRKPIIALTAHAMTEDRNKCLSIGCSDHLAKPVSSEELLKKISLHA
jgi:PAS domain S-box-containing protein